jgi:hypothetical protein
MEMTQPARPDDKLIDRYAQAIAHDDVPPAPHIRNAVLMYAATVAQQRKDAASAQPVRDPHDEEFPLRAANAPRWRTWAAASVAVTAIAGVLGWQFTKPSQPADTLAMAPHQGKAEQVAAAPSPAPALTPAPMQNAAAEKATSVTAMTSAMSLPAEPPQVAAATISRNEPVLQSDKAIPQPAPRQAETKLARAASPPRATTPRPVAVDSTKSVATIAAAPPAPPSPSREVQTGVQAGVQTGAQAARAESAKTKLADEATSASGAGSAGSTRATAAPAAAARVAAAPFPAANNAPGALAPASSTIATADKPASDSQGASSAPTSPPPAAGMPSSAAEQRARLLASLGRPSHEADPEQWWAHITQLRSKGRVKEADIEQIRLRDRYPAFKLPARTASEAEAAEPASAIPPPQR